MRSFIAAVALVSSVSLAQQPERAPKSQKPRIQNVEFTASEISADTAVPLGTIYLVPPKAKFDSLIRVRMNFNDKLAESVHEM